MEPSRALTAPAPLPTSISTRSGGSTAGTSIFSTIMLTRSTATFRSPADSPGAPSSWASRKRTISAAVRLTVQVCDCSIATLSIASGQPPPMPVIETTSVPDASAASRTATAKDVRAVCEIRITASFGSGLAIERANSDEPDHRASSPASVSSSAPSSAACWLEPVPTSHTRRRRSSRAASDATSRAASRSSSAGCAQIARSSCVLMRSPRAAPPRS
jgi:hypothetical protein